MLRWAAEKRPAGGGAGFFIAVMAALAAGAIAIGINILLLNGFDAAGIVTARGGLQKLVKMWLGAPLARMGVDIIWTSLGFPGPDTAVFKTGFKVGVGLLMALSYAFLIEPVTGGRWPGKSAVAAVLFWLVNALAVLPLLGEGVAGIHTLTPLGLASYAFAHTMFFVVLAWLYDLLMRERRRHTAG